MSKEDFHNFDPYEMLLHMDAAIKVLSKNCLELAKAHNTAQHHIDLLIERSNEQQQELLDLRCDLERITNYTGIMSKTD